MLLPSKAAHLQIDSWAGISLGASHFYGNLRFEDDRKELTYKLTAAQAARLDDGYQAGDSTERFFTEEAVIERALSAWQRLFPRAKVLLLGNSSYIEPKLILGMPGAPDAILMELSGIYLAAESIGFYDNPANDQKMDALNDRWHNIINGFLQKAI